MVMNVIDRFKVEYQEYKGLSPARRRDQLRALNSLATFADKPIEKCSAADFKKWMASLVKDVSPATVKKNGMAVRAFYTWAFSARLVSADTLMRVRQTPFPRGGGKRSSPRPYSDLEVKRFWRNLDQKFPLESDGKWLARWRRGTSHYKRVADHANHLQLTAIARIAFDGGLRSREIFDLDMIDMHYDNAFIVVRHGKGDKYREVPYTTAGRAAVRDWIEFRTELRPEHERPWLSLTTIGPPGVWLRPMHWRSFGGYVSRVGPWELHRMRHTCATNWLRAGMDIEVLRELLGHANIAETLVYAEVKPHDVQRQVERLEKAFQAQVA